MDPHSYSALLYLLPIFISWLVTLGLGWLAFQRRQVAGALPFATVLGLEAFWIGGYMLGLLSPTLDSKIFWENAQYIGTLLAPLMILVFAVSYCGYRPRAGRRLWAGLALPAVVVFGLCLTNPWHQWALLNQRLIPAAPFDYYGYDFGAPVYAILAYNYGLMAAALSLLFRHYRRETGLARRQTGFILAGILIPMISSLTIFMDIALFPQRDISPYYFAVADLFIAYGLFQYRLFDVVLFARELVIEHMADGVIIVDRFGRLLDINAAAQALLELPGHPPKERPFAELAPAWLGSLALDPATPSARQEVTLTRAGETWVYDAHTTRLMSRPGEFSGHMLVIRDITARRRDQDALEQRVRERTAELAQAEAEVRASLREKEVLLQEIHHRVKNNLQVVSSLLNLQSQSVNDPRVLELLWDSQNRVRTMALVHEKLYRSSDLARIDLAEYVQSLAGQLLRTYAQKANHVSLRVQAESYRVDIDTSIACGLILNELISNALKHAYPGDRRGEIVISLRPVAERRLALRVADDGVGFPPNLDVQATPSLGLQLVHSLVAQLEGVLSWERGAGAVVTIEFPSGPTEPE